MNLMVQQKPYRVSFGVWCVGLLWVIYVMLYVVGFGQYTMVSDRGLVCDNHARHKTRGIIKAKGFSEKRGGRVGQNRGTQERGGKCTHGNRQTKYYRDMKDEL
jgi:hypothetical protein